MLKSLSENVKRGIFVRGFTTKKLLKTAAVYTMLGILSVFVFPTGVSAQESSNNTGTQVSYNAKAAILIEAESGRVIFSQNIDEKLPMASTTKIMTSLIALEQEDLDSEFTVDSQAIQVEGSSMELKEGDIVSMRDLVYGMILPSGNDAANCVAVRISGSQEKFAELMNQKAQELGLTNTHFVTPSGLDADGHYSTAYDMAMLTREAMKNPDFTEICSQYRAQISFGNPPYERWLKNHNKLLEMYDGCIGVKTGFTDNAKRCLVSAAERDGVRLICVTLNAPDDWNIHMDMYNRAFASLSRRSLEEYIPKEITVPVSGGTDTAAVRVVPEEIPYSILSEQEFSQVQCVTTLSKLEFAPLNKGDTVGKAVFTLNGEEIASVNMVCDSSVEAIEVKKNIFIKLFDVIKGFFGA